LNSKPLIFTSLLFFSACGVKSDPIPPKGTALPSLITPYSKTIEDENKKTDKDKALKKNKQEKVSH
jgi:hypothetical protein